MSQVGEFLRKTEAGYMAFCPGCKEHHHFDERWTFSGDVARPSFNPSMHVAADTDQQCHAFVTLGKWRFLTDCRHQLAGQIVDMVAIESEPD